MKFTVNVGELSTELRGPCDRAKISTVIPILKHVRCEATDGRLSLLGHDLDCSSEAFVAAEVSSAGSCAIPAEPLSRLLSALPKAAHAMFELIGSDIIMKSGRSRYKLPIMGAADMPDPLSAEGGFTFQVSADDLSQLFERARPAIDPKEPTICFQGFYLHNDGGLISAVTTNRHFLLRFASKAEAKKFKGVIVPRHAADEMLKIGEGHITVSDRIISISSGARVFASKIIDATFPETYQRVIPQPSETPLLVYREAAIEALQRLRIVGDFSDSDLIDISVGDRELSLCVTGSADGSDTIECEGSSGAFTCLKLGQLLDALKSMKGEKVAFHILSERDPFRMIDPSEPSAICVLMPCASRTARRAEAA